MAIFNTTYYNPTNDEFYSDGEIENVLLERAKAGNTAVQNEDGWVAWAHFSPLRRNLLNWYPFEKDCSILEIGAGLGAITGLLCERAGWVTAIELTLRRAEINYERNKSANNLEIIVGDFVRIDLQKKYDYILIVGVLEYAQSMPHSVNTNPYVQLLAKAAENLTKDGKILLAIENRFGLKYFAGETEDHIGIPFVGIRGYEENSKARTFTRFELKELCKKANLNIQKWYYPYPDYKFPMEIFTNATVNSIVPATEMYSLERTQSVIFDEISAYKSLMECGIAQHFSNSFLVEIGKGLTGQNGIDYVKVNSGRAKQFSIYTIVDCKQQRVVKRPLCAEAKEHLQKMEKTWRKGIITTLPYKWDGESLNCRLLKKENAKTLLENYVKEKDIVQFWETIGSLKASLMTGVPTEQTENFKFVEVFGSAKCHQHLHWLENLNIDLICNNLFYEEQRWIAIDHELIFDFQIPAEYALWRCLVLSHFSDEVWSIMQSNINSFLGIDDETNEVFWSWEKHLQTEYYNIASMPFCAKHVIDINSLMQFFGQNSTLKSDESKDTQLEEGYETLTLEQRAQKQVEKISGVLEEYAK